LNGSPQLIADGLSTVELLLTTHDADCAGLPVAFVVAGGGSIDPPETTLPPLGTTAHAIYTTGLSASAIQIEAVIDDGQQRASVALTTEVENMMLDGQYTAPLLEEAPFLLPITLTLSNEERPVNGRYQLNVSVDSGSLLRQPDEAATGTSRLELPVTGDGGTSIEQLLYFVPTEETDSALLQAQIIGRADAGLFERRLYWTELVNQVTLIATPAAIRNQPDTTRRYIWEMEQAQSLCLNARAKNGLLLNPRVLRLRYEPLLVPGELRLFVDAVQQEAGKWFSTDISSAEHRYFNGAACLGLTASGNSGGLLNVNVSAELIDRSDQALLLLHYGTLNLDDYVPPLRFVFRGAADDQTPTLTFDALPTAIDAYLLDDSGTVLLSVWVPAEMVQAASGMIHPGEESADIPLIFDPNNPSAVLMTDSTDGIMGVYVSDSETDLPIIGGFPDEKPFYHVYVLATLETEVEMLSSPNPTSFTPAPTLEP
jgi:hypothetical protein